MNAARSGAALMQRAHDTLPPGAALGIVRGPEQLLLQARGDVRAFGFKAGLEAQRDAAIRWLRASPQHWLLIQQRHLEPCFLDEHTRDVGWSNRRQWRLAPQAALAPACAQPDAGSGVSLPGAARGSEAT
jgi:hypothetical protein